MRRWAKDTLLSLKRAGAMIGAAQMAALALALGACEGKEASPPGATALETSPARATPSTPKGGSMEKYKKPSEEEIKRKLTPLQYKVTQKEDTEPPFKNEFWDNHRAGIYADVVTGEPLFSSLDKFDSGTGWPSFTRPLEESNIAYREDRRLFSKRTEVRSKAGDSHLGHVFDDGPPPTGKRYCMNSAALRFIPAENLEKEGYAEYAKLFRKTEGGGK